MKEVKVIEVHTNCEEPYYVLDELPNIGETVILVNPDGSRHLVRVDACASHSTCKRCVIPRLTLRMESVGKYLYMHPVCRFVVLRGCEYKEIAYARRPSFIPAEEDIG